MPTVKREDTDTSGSSSSSSRQSGQQAGKGEDKPDLSFLIPGRGETEPETVTASWGDEGEDPAEVGFVGTKPKDKDPEK